MAENTCKHCGTSLIGPICHQCGQKFIAARWSVSDLWKQFLTQVTNIEKGFLHTILSLFKKPGVLISDYWNGITIPYYNPFRYALILIAINLIVSYWLGINEMLEASMNDETFVNSIDPDQYEEASDTFNQWLNILVLLLIPFRAFFTFLLFKSIGHNYAEHLILNAFIVGQQAFFSSFTQFIFYAFPAAFVIYIPFNFLIGFLYDTWVFKRTFKERIIFVMIKAFIVGLLGIISFLSLVAIFSSIALYISG